MARKPVRVGLGENPLTPGELEEILAGFEQVLVRTLRRLLGRRLDYYHLIVEAQLSPDGRSLEVSVDLTAAGRQIAPASYEEVLAEAIDEAARWLEARLRERRGGQEGG